MRVRWRRRRQLDASDPNVAAAALKIQGAIKGMLHRQRTSVADADSADLLAATDDGDVPDVMGSTHGSHASSALDKTSPRSGHERPASTQEDAGRRATDDERQRQLKKEVLTDGEDQE